MPVGLLLFGLLHLSANTGRSADASSEFTLISSSVYSFGSTTRKSPTTVCVEGFSREAFSDKLKQLWNIMRLVFRCLDTGKKQSVARRLRRVIGHTKFYGSQTCTSSLYPSFINVGDSPFSIHESSPFLRIIFPEREPLVRLHHYSSCGEMHHCQQQVTDVQVRNLTDLRQLSFVLSCWRSEEYSPCLNTNPLDFVEVLVQIPCFLASKFHVCFSKICTTS